METNWQPVIAPRLSAPHQQWCLSRTRSQNGVEETQNRPEDSHHIGLSTRSTAKALANSLRVVSPTEEAETPEHACLASQLPNLDEAS